MNSDAKRILSHQFDPYQNADAYSSSYYSLEHLWERLTQPTVLVSILVLVLTLHHRLASTDGQSRRLSEFAWDSLVYLIPAALLYAIHDWLNPPLFPVPMLQTRSRSHAAKSDVLRKVLGTDKPGGIMMSVSQAGRRSLSVVGLGAAAESERPAGLGNWDNSCYQNSILQSLAALKPLPAYLTGPPAFDTWRYPATTTTVDTLRDLIRDLNDANNNGKTLWTPGVLKNMSTWQQQDAQEYFSKLLDVVDGEVARAAKAAQKHAGLENDLFARDDSAASQHSDDSGYQSLSNQSKNAPEPRPVHSPLEGLAAQRVACTSCGYSEGLSLIPFNCLTITLGTDVADHDLYERLDSYTKVESIPGVYCPKCTLQRYKARIERIIQRSRDAGTRDEEFPEPFARLRAAEEALEDDAFDDETLSRECKIIPQQRVASTKTKQAVIARPPQSLAIHMNRSVFDETTGAMFKNPAAVRFPVTLDLGPWCLGSADGPAAPEPGGVAGAIPPPPPPYSATDPQSSAAASSAAEEQWLLDPEASMVAGDMHPSRITGPIYELRAVITHFGRHENGHYVCYRKHPRVTTRSSYFKMANSAGHDDPPDDAVSLDEEPRRSGSTGDDDSEHETETGTSPRGALELQREEGEESGTMEDEDTDAGSDWWRLSDQDVTRVNEEQVLAQGGVFMLFYDCIDPNYALLSDSAADSGDRPADPPSPSPPSSPPPPPPRAHDSPTTADEEVAETASEVPLSPSWTAGRSDTESSSGDDGEEILVRARMAPLPADEDDEGL